MAKKPKGFGELLHQQRKAEETQKSMDKLAKRVKQSFQGKLGGVVTNPKGEVKMSEVLEDFVGPYINDDLTLIQRQNLFQIAIIAWNIPLLPEDQQQAALNNIIDKLSVGQSEQHQEDTKEILTELIERKQKHFAKHKRYILDFELTENKDEFHLSVVSTMPNPQDS